MKKMIAGMLLTGLSITMGFSQIDLIKKSIVANDPNLLDDDIKEIRITSQYIDTKSSVEHIYGNQQLSGLDIYGAVFDAHFLDGNLLTIHQNFIVDANGKLSSKVDKISASSALEKAFEFAGIKLESDFGKSLFSELSEPKSELIIPAISSEPIKFRMVFFYHDNLLQKGWLINLYPLKGDHWWNLVISSNDGSILHHEDWVIECQPTQIHSEGHSEFEQGEAINRSTKATPNSYRVFAIPVESPNHGSRSVVTNPADSMASPFGWHDVNGVKGAEYTYTRGNNAYARDDRDANNTGGLSSNGGTDLNFDSVFDVTQSAANFLGASVINLFYMNNVMHDVWYQYGFNEVAGNFQQSNYNRGQTGVGANDQVNADAQDGGGSNNANFATPPDGQAPRMQMYLWSAGSPPKVYDSDFDNGVISHEYGHGISIRLTGGPGNSSCLTNGEQMGEGWSDFFALVMTHQPNAKGSDLRGISTYLVGQNPNGSGIRTYRYSTNMAASPYTYNSIKTLSVPHGVGSVWCAMIWDMYWELIDKYGYDPDVYNGSGGNNLAMQLVIDGMKLQPCNPGFTDARDAILLADRINNGGSNQILIWKNFARRGLGFSASQGLTSSRGDGKEGYDIPPIFVNEMQITKQAEMEKVAGSNMLYSVKLKNNTLNILKNVTFNDTLSVGLIYISSSGCPISVKNNILSFKLDTVKPGDTLQCKYIVRISGDKFTKISDVDSLEGDVSKWLLLNEVGTIKWKLAQNRKKSGANCFFVGNPATKSDQSIYKEFDFTNTPNPGIAFWHYFNTEDGWDGGVVEIKEAESANPWTDAKDLFVQGAYNSTIALNPESNISGRSAFTGLNTGFTQSIIDLSAFAGKKVWFRFRFVADGASGGEGWYVDDIQLLDLHFIKNTAYVTVGGSEARQSTVYTLVSQDTGTISAVSPIANNEISLYPNPTDEYLTIVSERNTPNLQVASIFSNEGKLLLMQTLKESEIKVDLSDFAPGVYVLQIQSYTGSKNYKVLKY